MAILKLIIIDDEMGIREGSKRALRKFELDLPYIEEAYTLDITLAASGEEAIEKFKQDTYDIALLDNKLPGIHGTEVLEYMKNNNLNTLTIMITAFASIETAVSATKNGAYDFLTKPFSPEDLRSAVQKAAKHYVLNEITRQITEEKNKIRFQFLSVLSHELKSPIAAVTNYLKLMKEHISGENISDYDSFINRSIIRMDGMQKLIFDLLDLTRIESGEKKRELTDVNITDIIKESISNCEADAKTKNISIHFEEESPIIMKADSTEIEIIVNNLISNSIKYNRDNGSVNISLIKEDDFVKFSVADTGIGLSENEIKKLFKEFSRIKNDKTKSIAGSGIGLSTVKKIANLYNGDATVTSKENEGSTFTIILKQ